MRTARFDSNDHAVTEGWATYHKDLKGRLALPPFVCRVFGHPRVAPPKSRNGHSPSNYARCRRCNRWMKWYVVRQHRYGGPVDGDECACGAKYDGKTWWTRVRGLRPRPQTEDAKARSKDDAG